MALSKIKPGDRLRTFPSEAFNGLVDLLGKTPDGSTPVGSDGFGDRTVYDLIITDQTVVTADAKWTYTVKILYDDVASTAWGGGTEGDVEYNARNTWEDITRVGDNAGYENTSVTALKPIPVGAVVEGRLIEVSGACFFRFRERNEPVC